MTPARYILLLLLASFFALVGVAQRAHGIHLGSRVARLHDEKDLLARKNRVLVFEISALSDPVRIAGQVERLKMPLMDPVELSKAVAKERAGEFAPPARKATVSARR